MNRYKSGSSSSRLNPLKRCKTKEDANVVFIDVDDDDDDVIVVDSSLCSNHKQGGSSEQRENQRVSPQSVISIQDDDESYNHLSAFDEEGFPEFDSDASSSLRSGRAYGFTRHARSEYNRDFSSRNSYRFGGDEFEYEPIEVDSDCEVIEDSSELREQWEKAASRKKVNGHKGNFDAGGSTSASAGSSDAVRQKDMTDPSTEAPYCSKSGASFSGMKSSFSFISEQTHMPHDQDSLFPEFDWRNLGGRSSPLKPKSADSRGIFQEKCSINSEGISSENPTSRNNIGGANHKKGLDDRCGGTTLESEGTVRGECSMGAKPRHNMNINQTDSGKAHEINASRSLGYSYLKNNERDEHFRTADLECACIFPNYCECKTSRDLGVAKVHMEEPLPNHIPCKEKFNTSVPDLNNKTRDGPNSSPVGIGTGSETNCSENGSQEKDGGFEKLSRSEIVVRQEDTPSTEGDVQPLKSDIINVKERLKETEEYKRTMEQEMALRQQQIKLQAEEAQRLRKRKKAESLRLSNLERRQKQRLEEVRESQKQDGANLNLKEQLRSEIMKELKAMESRCFDMSSLLRSLGVQVEGGLHPSPQQVHAAYKRAVLKFHPDRASGSNIKQQVEAEEKFKLISRMKEKFKFR
ncbi:unnamed protein product [Rhodiola kirilowii]